jgi:HEAT repeat protein
MLLYDYEREPITAGELLANLEQRPEYVERQRREAERREENRRRYAAAGEGLFEELRAAGFPVRNLADLRRRGVGGPRAVPILLQWLPRISYVPLKVDLVHTLGSSWARPGAIRPLIQEFHRIDSGPDSHRVRFAIGGSLQHIADDSVVDELVEIARDSCHGRDRALVVAALGNMRKSTGKVLPVLLELLNDDEIIVETITGLCNLKAPEARGSIEPFLEHPDSLVRSTTKKALAKLDRAAAKKHR